MNEKPELRLRAAKQYDMPFVRSSWFESYRKGGRAPEVGFDLFRKEHDDLMRRILRYADVQIAFPVGMPENDDTICGWVCYQGNIVHYVYTKLIYRRRGIADHLIESAVPKEKFPLRTHTFETTVGRRLASKSVSQYNPYVLYHLNLLENP